MNEFDPYKHIRALAESIAYIEKQIETDDRVVADPIDAQTDGRRSEAGIEAVAVALRTARVREGLTQRELGRLAGVPQSHISKIESGAVDLRLSSILAIAQVLGLTLTLEPRAADTGARDAATPPRAPAIAALRHDQPPEELPARVAMIGQ